MLPRGGPNGPQEILFGFTCTAGGKQAPTGRERSSPALRPAKATRRPATSCPTLGPWDGVRGGGQSLQSALLERRARLGRTAGMKGRALCGRPNISGGDDQRRRTRVAGATGALAAGAPRPRCRDLRAAALAGLRSVAGPALEKAQAHPARPDFLHRGSAHSRHYCLARISVDPTQSGLTKIHDTLIGTQRSAEACSARLRQVYSGWMPASRITLVQRSVSSRLSLAMSCAVPAPAVRLSSRKRALVVASLAISLIARLSFKTIAAGVFGGALMAFHVSDTKSGIPISMNVGMPGSMSSR